MKLLKSLIAAAALIAGCVVQAQDIKITNLSKNAKTSTMDAGNLRCISYKLADVPKELKGLPTVFTTRGKSTEPGAGFSFTTSKAATIYICVHNRGKATIPDGWTKTNLKVVWLAGKAKLTDTVYKKDFAAGKVEIPAHDGKAGTYGIPNLAVVQQK